MKKKVLPVLVVFSLIIIIVAIMGVTSLVRKYTPSKEQQDLFEYYGLTSEEQVSVIMNNEIVKANAKLIGDAVYVDYHFVHDVLNPRFYWDANENILLYATPRDLISAEADKSSYLITKSSVDFGLPIVKATSDSAYINLDFVREYSDFIYEYAPNPNRIILINQWGDYNVASIKRNTHIRVKGGIKSPILSDISAKEQVTVLSADEAWTKIITDDGIIGYVESKRLSDISTMSRSGKQEPETFTHIVKNFDICMAWHQVTTRASNSNVASILSNTKGINVISPTWFYLDGNDGSIASLASSDYVTYCHSQGIEVWALVSNLENSNVDSSYVLTHTSTRQSLVNQIISAAIQYDLDGINLDFEALVREEVGDAYIQFIRELSIKCANNGIVLSVDNYVPTSYTSFYNRAEQGRFADYVIIMGYDEHYSGSEEEGSVASLSWVRQGVIDTLAEVPGNQVILGMPFYTRVWKLTPEEGSEGSEAEDVDMFYSLSSEIYSMRNANNFVNSYNADRQWLSDCGQNYAEFKQDNVIYKVWLEDAASTAERLELLKEYDLAGASFWKLTLEENSIWDTIIKYIN